MKKKDRIVIASREGLEAIIGNLVQLKLAVAGTIAEKDAAIAALETRYQENLTPTLEEIERTEAAIHAYCDEHRDVLFPDTKSISLLVADFGYEMNPHRVEKVGKDTWDKVAVKVNQLSFGAPYVREGKLELDKKALVADRDKLTPEQLKLMGVRIEQDEQFFIRPRSEAASATVIKAEAA